MGLKKRSLEKKKKFKEDFQAAKRWYFDRSDVCGRAELPGRSVKVYVDLMRDDLKAKQRQLVFDPLLSG